MDQIAKHQEPIMVTGRRSNVVMISEEEWRGILETFYLASIPGMAESIVEAKNSPKEEWSDSLPW